MFQSWFFFFFFASPSATPAQFDLIASALTLLIQAGVQNALAAPFF